MFKTYINWTIQILYVKTTTIKQKKTKYIFYCEVTVEMKRASKIIIILYFAKLQTMTQYNDYLANNDSI